LHSEFSLLQSAQRQPHPAPAPEEIPRMTIPTPHRSVAQWVARFLAARGIGRVFGLQGGPIQPIWDRLAQFGVRIVDVRNEGAVVHRAHAHAALSGPMGVCLASAGPGVGNCVTAITHAHLERGQCS
jgi:acetolactate synthase-1/2/3 large subunit